MPGTDSRELGLACFSLLEWSVRPLMLLNPERLSCIRPNRCSRRTWIREAVEYIQLASNVDSETRQMKRELVSILCQPFPIPDL